MNEKATSEINNTLTELEAIIQLMEEKVTTLKQNCRRARELLAKVSTSATKPSTTNIDRIVADAITKRRLRMAKKGKR